MSILNHICEALLIDKNTAGNFISTAPHRYKVYTIPKRNSLNSRLIAQPSKEVKVLQKIGEEYLRNFLPVHHAATAYEKGASIKTNALRHKNNAYLLKMDFSNFFNNIVPIDLLYYVDNNMNNVSEIDKKVITNLFFWKPKRSSSLMLSIGAPSSPFISNTVMYEFDEAIQNYCQNNKITYTRYADDMTFTTNRKGVLFETPEIIESTLKNIQHPDIKINRIKTVFSSKKHNRHITGVTITNESKLSLGRKKKRVIRSMAHKYSQGLLNKEEQYKLRGLLAFCYDIEPEFVSSLMKKYKKLPR